MNLLTADEHTYIFNLLKEHGSLKATCAALGISRAAYDRAIAVGQRCGVSTKIKEAIARAYTRRCSQ